MWTALKSFYPGAACTVKVNPGLGEWFIIGIQHCVFSPLMFGIAIDFIMGKTVDIVWVIICTLEDLNDADGTSKLF